ncbi:TPA: FRG domain-containing protein [Serratia liquefaciens]|nr:FRG domain-containing protein [Serratia liquefaciens]
MFNLIVGGEPEIYDRWPTFTNKNGTETFPLSRMLEATTEEIRLKLTPLTEKSLALIEELTTVFMTEEYLHDDKKCISLRVGYISNLKFNEKGLEYNYEVMLSYDDIELEQLKSKDKLSAFGPYGLHRSHWAIKDITLRTFFKYLGIPFRDQVKNKKENVKELVDDVTSDVVINNVQEFLHEVLNSNYAENCEVFYRGHSDVSYQLTPSLFRKTATDKWRHLEEEATMVREILTARPAEFINDSRMLDKLVRMQHFGLPTRLLDITSNPLIALYFACSGVKYKNGKEVDGHVISFSTPRNNIKFFDSDTVSCVANLAMLSSALKKDLEELISNKTRRQDSASCLKLLHHIKEEKSYFEDRINPADLCRVIFVKGRVSNERISSQSGAFLLFGHNAVLPELDPTFGVKRIIIRDKKSILSQLAKLNITEGTIYPGMERAIAEISKKYANDD